MDKTNKVLLGGILLMAIAIPLTTWMAITNQETRSKAASDEVVETVIPSTETVIDGSCGEMNGESVTVMPDNRYACAKGAVNWMDSKADDGTYNWDCIGTKDGMVTHCTATLAK